MSNQDGPIYRSNDDEAAAIQQDRINMIIQRESELGAYALEDVKELGKWTR